MARVDALRDLLLVIGLADPPKWVDHYKLYLFYFIFFSL